MPKERIYAARLLELKEKLSNSEYTKPRVNYPKDLQRSEQPELDDRIKAMEEYEEKWEAEVLEATEKICREMSGKYCSRLSSDVKSIVRSQKVFKRCLDPYRTLIFVQLSAMVFVLITVLILAVTYMFSCMHSQTEKVFKDSFGSFKREFEVLWLNIIFNLVMTSRLLEATHHKASAACDLLAKLDGLKNSLSYLRRYLDTHGEETFPEVKPNVVVSTETLPSAVHSNVEVKSVDREVLKHLEDVNQKSSEEATAITENGS